MIEKRREELEEFIKKQIIGPGAMEFKYQFRDINDYTLYNDILISPPASIYSTAILFPLKSRTKSNEETAKNDSPEHVEIEEDDDNIELLEENPTPMFNNAIGISFVVRNIESLKDLKLKIAGRHYKKTKSNEAAKLIGVRIESDLNSFRKYFNEFESIKNNLVLVDKILALKEDVDINNITIEFKDEIKQTKEKLLNNFKSQNISSRIAQILDTEIRDYKYLASLETSIYWALRREKNIYLLDAIEKIESFNEFESIINDLLKLQRKVWVSSDLDIEVHLAKLDIKEFRYRDNYLYKDHKCLHNLTSEINSPVKLSCNLSLSKNRRNSTDNNIYVKVQLINTSDEVRETANHYYSVVNDEVNKRSLFDATIKIQGSKILFRSYNTISKEKKNTYEEEETTKFLYRRFKDYAVGHNCSANWNLNNEEIVISSTFLPEVETPDVDTVPRNLSKRINEESKFKPDTYIKDTQSIEIKSLSTLSELSDNDVIDKLNVFIEYYSSWIKEKRKKLHEQPNLIEQELKRCENDYLRIKKNILALKDNSKSLKSFRIMNTAMFIQMWHSENVKKGNVKDYLENENFNGFTKEFYHEQSPNLYTDSPVVWRSFQLAFILLNIDGIVKIGDNEKWPERNEVVDLVWFPTGGGKTEAYLGIIAFTIAYRRLVHEKKGGGVSAIMRYTLRLLTLQQFQRATILILALELIRRWKIYSLGEEPISIGMWVGQNSMPNTRADLKKAFEEIDQQIDNWKGNGIPDINTKIPFSNCPCCGTEFYVSKGSYKTSILRDNYVANGYRLQCLNSKCSFSYVPKKFRRSDQNALPILLSDEDIYENPPTLLFGTVDKFALLAHKTDSRKEKRYRDSRRIFGNPNCAWETFRKGGYLPPDLIIQDELHLLSGPLGTAVALFENVVDQLCSRSINGNTIRPKIISSTATTRNTNSQIGELYNRRVNLFPKPGIDCDDSFFAFYKRDANDKLEEYSFVSKRKYIGILPTGRTQMWMQMRLSALCFIHRLVYENSNLTDNVYRAKQGDYPEKAIDFYYTLISYFNSKKEVGKTSSQVDTYLIKELRKVFAFVARHGKSLFNFYCKRLNQIELTGRLSGPQVQKNLSIVGESFKDESRLNGFTPPDLVIATNMIAVGLDVSRFNVILMNSMPRNIAEYIQASSRVARNQSGLVLTLHHPFRSRDLSHFEKFIDFHEKFYGYVEPISITPFSEKALKRYLNLYVATYLRQTSYPDNIDASKIDLESKNDIKKRLIEFFSIQRPKIGIGNKLSNEALAIIEKIIDEAINDWQEKRENEELIWFSNPQKKDFNLYVPINEYETKIQNEFWKIPMSLRSVEPETVVRILNK